MLLSILFFSVEYISNYNIPALQNGGNATEIVADQGPCPPAPAEQACKVESPLHLGLGCIVALVKSEIFLFLLKLLGNTIQ